MFQSKKFQLWFISAKSSLIDTKYLFKKIQYWMFLTRNIIKIHIYKRIFYLAETNVTPLKSYKGEILNISSLYFAVTILLSHVINSNKVYLLALPSRGKLSLFLFSSAPQKYCILSSIRFRYSGSFWKLNYLQEKTW